jgi:hypothetical protein
MICSTGCAIATVTIPHPISTPTPLPTLGRLPTTSSCPATYDISDDRTTPEGIIRSFYNAITRAEFDRAYTYLISPDGASKPDQLLAEWKQGYNGTDCVIITYLGSATTVNDTTTGYKGIVAGMSLPLTIIAIEKDGTRAIYSGTHAIHHDPSRPFIADGFIVLSLSHFYQVG